MEARLAETRWRTGRQMLARTKLNEGTGNKRESVIAVLAIGRNRLPVATGWIREDDSKRVSAIAAPEAIVTRAGDRPETPAQIVPAVEIVSGTKVFPVAVALVTPAPLAEEGDPVGTAPVATVHVAPPAWAHPGAAVAAADGADDVFAYMAIGRNQ